MGVVKLSQASLSAFQKYTTLLAGNNPFSEGNYFITRLSIGQFVSLGFDINVTDTIQVPFAGARYDGSNDEGTVVQIAKTGEVLNSNKYSNTTGDIRAFIQTVNNLSDGKYYCVAYDEITGNSDSIALLLNSDWSIASQNKFGTTSNLRALRGTVDSSDNFYRAGYDETNAGRVWLSKNDSTGAKTWATTFIEASGSTTPYGVELVGSNLILTFNLFSNGGVGYRGHSTTDGTDAGIAGKVYHPSTNPNHYNAETDGTTVSLVGLFNYLTSQGHITNFTPGTGVNWSVAFSDPGGTACYLFDVSLDNAGNHYAVGYATISGQIYGIIVKTDSSGTVLWTRKFAISNGGTPHNLIFYGVAVDGDALVVSGRNTTDNSIFVTRVPTDGSLTGSYTVAGNTCDYSTWSPTVNTSTGITHTTLSTNIVQTYSPTESAGSLTQAGVTLTEDTAIL